MKFAFCAPLAIGCSPTRSMSAQVDASDCRLAVRGCPVTDGELEPVVAEVLELAAEIERLQRSVRVLVALGRTSGVKLTHSPTRIRFVSSSVMSDSSLV